MINSDKYFEIYTQTDNLSPQNWHKIYSSILSRIGKLGKFEIILSLNNNMVRFFISSKKDLDLLSNDINGFILQPITKLGFDLPLHTKKEPLLQFITGGNLLDLKEKIAIKRSKDLQFVIFKITAINSNKALVSGTFYLTDKNNKWSKITKIMTIFPSELLAIDFTKNTRYLKKSMPIYLNIEKSLHMMVREDQDAIFKVNTFPYLSHNYYLNLAKYDFDRHSFIIGASGSGKSKLISLFIDRLNRTALKMNYRLVVIDPHASLKEDLNYIPKSKVITFGKNSSTSLFPDSETDLASATELTATLFKSILNEQFNPRLDKLLRFSLFTLMTAQIMSLENLKRFLTETEYRNSIIEHVKNYIPDNLVKFFGSDFNEMRTLNYNETILPIISMIDEMQLQPSLVGNSDTSLAQTIRENFLTVFSLNKISMGEKVVKTIAGLIIQQIFLLAQSRTFGQKIILIIDEVSIVQNPALVQILAEARKFNLTVILTQQYFGQVGQDLRNSIFSNVYNYYIFKTSEEDARDLEGNINIVLPKSLIKSEMLNGRKESDIKIKMMTELHPRECLVRVLSSGQIVPCIKARTMNAPKTTVQPQDETKKQIILPEKFVENKPPNENQSLAETDSEITKPPAPPKSFSSIYNLMTMNQPSKADLTKEKDAK